LAGILIVMDIIKAFEVKVGDMVSCMDLKDRVVRSVHHQMGEMDRANSGKYAAIVRLEYTDGVVEHYETAKTSFRGVRGR
jgi:hypothetical protein